MFETFAPVRVGHYWYYGQGFGSVLICFTHVFAHACILQCVSVLLHHVPPCASRPSGLGVLRISRLRRSDWALRTFHRLLRNCHEAIDLWRCPRCFSAKNWIQFEPCLPWALATLQSRNLPDGVSHCQLTTVCNYICNLQLVETDTFSNDPLVIGSPLNTSEPIWTAFTVCFSQECS